MPGRVNVSRGRRAQRHHAFFTPYSDNIDDLVLFARKGATLTTERNASLGKTAVLFNR